MIEVLVPGWQRVHLVDADQVEMGGVLGSAYNQGLARLSRDPFSVPFLLADVNFGMKRWFTNYSGDISGRFIEIASLMSPPGRMTPETLPAVLENISRYQKADGHFGREEPEFTWEKTNRADEIRELAGLRRLAS